MLGAATLAVALGMAAEPVRYRRYRRHGRPQVRERTLTQDEMTVPYPPPSVVLLQRVRPAAVPHDWATVGDKGFSNFEERWRGR